MKAVLINSIIAVRSFKVRSLDLLKKTKLSILTVIIAAFTGCQSQPRLRLGFYPSSTIGSKFLNPEKLGPHSYTYNPFESNGIVYTCAGGHIDIAHVRIAADHTKYLYEKTKKHILNNKPRYSFRMVVEPSIYNLKIQYPRNWQNLSGPEKYKYADLAARDIAQYLTFTCTTWHEVLVWFGFKCAAVIPEFPSAFSWEDNYSNLLGIKLAIQAIDDPQNDYNNAMTILINKKLKQLGVISLDKAIDATESVRDQWFSGQIIVDMKKRHFDIGLDDGYVTPFLIPYTCPSQTPASLPVPTLANLEKIGFKAKLTIHPKEWETPKIAKALGKTKKPYEIDPQNDMPALMAYIKNQAKNKYGYKVVQLPAYANASKNNEKITMTSE